MRFINDIIKPLIRFTRSGTLVILGLLLSLSANAQGWEKYYGLDAGEDEANAIIQTIDQGYAIVGSSNSFTGSFDIYVIRTDVDGKILWEKNIGAFNQQELGYDIVETADQGLVVIGETTGGGPFGGKDVFLQKIDKKGNFVWQQYFGTNGDDRGLGLNITQDGGLVLVGESEGSIYIIKTDENGDLEWETFLDTDNGVGYDVIETSEGDFIAVGSDGNNTESDVYVARLNNLGEFLHSQTYGGAENDVAYKIIQASDGEFVVAGKKGNGGNFYVLKLKVNTLSFEESWIVEHGDDFVTEEARSVIETSDNNFVLAGYSDYPTNDQGFLQASILKISGNNGGFIWQKDYGRNRADAFNGIVQTPWNGFVMTGFTSSPPNFSPFDVLLVKADSEGNLAFNTHIQGNVYYDFGNDCNYNGTQPGVKNWIVKAVGEKTYYGTTDENGNYDIKVDLGQYSLSVVPKNNYWEICPTNYPVNFPAPYDTLTRNFGITPASALPACTDLEVDLSTPFVKACENSTYTINYCNHGTLDAAGIEIGLILSNNLSYVSSSLPLGEVIDSLYTFDIGNLDIGECGSFTITVLASCDALIAETHSIKAHITPEGICPEYNGAEIAVNGFCDGDSVRFEIRNVGQEAINQAVDYIVIEDIIMGLQGQPNIPNLGPQESVQFAYEANGATYRLTAKQISGHPGNSFSPSIAVEGCVAGGGTNYSTGFYTQLPEDDKDHFLSYDGQENIDDNFSSQAKRGYPKGYGDSLKIASTTDLKYHIKFQNVGPETAIRLVIRDTISPFLDPQTVRPGASSHDYEFEVYDNGILKFTFNNIMLIDSSTNEAASHGFVKYRITQKPDNPLGSLVKSGAAIFFDYYAPQVTDSTCHVIAGTEWTDFIITSDHEIYIPQTEIKIYPNPVSQFATFELEGASIHPPLDFEVYDVAGRLVRSERFFDTTFVFNRGNLSAGMYFYKISSRSQLISTGKIITK